MAWRNRISGIKGRNHSFQKLNKITVEGDVDDDTPLLVTSTSSLVSTPTSIRNGSGGGSGNFGFPTKRSKNKNSNIAAVPDEIEALSFSESNLTTSPIQFNDAFQNEQGRFVAQFQPHTMTMMNEDLAEAALIFDGNDDANCSNDGSIYTEGSTDKSSRQEVNEIRSHIISLRPPSLDSKCRTKSSNGNRESKTRSSTSSRSKRSRNRSTCASTIEGDADAATWKADEVDAFVDAEDFGNSSTSGKRSTIMQSVPSFEISGVNLLIERDTSVNELQEVSHLMTFNALVLIQKQKDWIEGSSDATDGANKGSSSLITMELENLERKIKLLMDYKEWPNEKERQKQEADPLTPSKAFFKAMALIDRSIEQFHKGYLKYISNNSEENRELKAHVDKLEVLSASLQDEASRSRQKTETIRNLQKDRDDLTRKVERTDERLASLVRSKIPVEEYEISASPNKESKFHVVKSYIHKLELERDKYLTEVSSLKTSLLQNTDLAKDDESRNRNSLSSDEADQEDERRSCVSTTTDGSNEKLDEVCVLDDDLGSQWHTLKENEDAKALAASKEQEVNKLSAKVTERDSALSSLRSECKLMRMQLMQLETNRNEYKSQCQNKDSALVASQDRIATLEDEVLRTHARCATYEEDYEALKESINTQKEATKQELNNSQNELKERIGLMQTDFDDKLRRSEEELTKVKLDRERLVRDMKASVKDIESERDNLRTMLAEKSERNYREEKKESDVPTPPLSSDGDVKQESKDTVCTTDKQRLIELENEVKNFEQTSGRFAEKSSNQALAIATLQEENEMKDEQLKSLNEMVEYMRKQLAEKSSRQVLGQRISNLRDLSQRTASDLFDRSRHGSNSMHGSRHGIIDDD